MTDEILTFLARQHPYDALSEATRAEVAAASTWIDLDADAPVYALGTNLTGLYVIASGQVRITDGDGTILSLLASGNSFGERGLLRDGRAATTAVTQDPTRLLHLPADLFHRLHGEDATFRAFFARGRSAPEAPRPSDLSATRVADLMVRDPIAVAGDVTVIAAAQMMQARKISCLCITEGTRLIGLVTLRDLVGRALAEGIAGDTPLSQIMTRDPITLPPEATGTDVLHLMAERHMGHVPIVARDRLLGIVTQTDLTRFQSATSAGLVAEAAQATDVEGLAAATARLPQMLAQLVAAGHRHDTVTRAVTDVADVVTRRLLALGEAQLGPAPGRYLWLACGSQGRREQTGVSDQDNVLILEDGLPDEALPWFDALARFVSDGLNACGYIYCPGDMMATNPRWTMPVSAWRDTFAAWIATPSKEAQMLASVMFDLRPIGGDMGLFDGLHAETLAQASGNSIFTAHMATNALSHAPPLGMLRGFATIRSGEHRKTIDLKLSGVVPVVDLARMYALQSAGEAVATRDRLTAAIDAGAVSASGGRDLLDAYDLIADTRLAHQARQIRMGHAPDNFLAPSSLSEFERSHLRDAFVVVKRMQSALMQGRGLLG
ncbi:histidine kinase [Jannaschia pagri]|uniref:Histidine kinase n=1 Tax=Jannaschia pagri TaxID=2829797 RepID=A0ABQ4NIV7_9RHOB|nr:MULTISPECIES: putative nucleotidyltransferase substrate binding domain-containing protein [unclassified Jannaschia]GIT89570.1 histidine kinase [Jannaschia sp. AI_61]GIT94322.1 histidine kinase [Jannaschia sp. AI_62]